MVSNLVFDQLVLIALVWVFLLLCWLEPSEHAASCPTTPQTLPPPRTRSTGPKPFTGLTRKPYCEACEQAIEPHREPPVGPPPRIVSTRGRRRHVDTSHQFCPDPNCRYGGWIGLANISANGHPSGGPWRQLYCSRSRTLGRIGKINGLLLPPQPHLLRALRLPPERSTPRRRVGERPWDWCEQHRRGERCRGALGETAGGENRCPTGGLMHSQRATPSRRAWRPRDHARQRWFRPPSRTVLGGNGPARWEAGLQDTSDGGGFCRSPRSA